MEATYCRWFGEERHRRSHQRWSGGGSCFSPCRYRGASGGLHCPSWDSAVERSWERRGKPSGCRAAGAGSCRECPGEWLATPWWVSVCSSPPLVPGVGLLRQDPFFSAEPYKGQQHDITQENLLHILDFWHSNILSVPKPQGKDLWLRCVGEKCKVSKDSSRKLIICSNVIYNPVTSESFPHPCCWIQEGQSTALELKGMTFRTWILFHFCQTCLFKRPPPLTVSKLHSDLVETSNTAKILLQMYQKFVLSCPEPDPPSLWSEFHTKPFGLIFVSLYLSEWNLMWPEPTSNKLSLLFHLFPSESHK